MRSIGRILCALGLAFSLSSCGPMAPAYAEDNCGDAKAITESLGRLDQKQVGGGVVSEQVVVVIYATPTGSRWTAVSVAVDGSACLLAHGTQWFGGLPEVPAEDERGA